MQKRLVVFTGAGISAESGIPTFRDNADSLWENYDIDAVATHHALNTNPNLVNKFHNELRRKVKTCEPNEAHKLLVKLEDNFDVTVITQNIDDLHERAGSRKVYHLHGEILKARCLETNAIVECDYDITEKSKLRPHTVLFGEMPYNVDEAYEALRDCDILLIIGTSLQIGYTVHLLKQCRKDIPVFYIDPKINTVFESCYENVTYVKKKAVDGMKFLLANTDSNGNFTLTCD